MKTITITISGNDRVVSTVLDAYARSRGWYDGVTAKKDNKTLSQLDFATQAFRVKFNETLTEVIMEQWGKGAQVVDLKEFDRSSVELLSIDAQIS